MSICLDLKKKKNGSIYVYGIIDGKRTTMVVKTEQEGKALILGIVKKYFEKPVEYEPNKKEGYIYVASHKDIPHFKIGRTSQQPEKRIEGLSQCLINSYKLEYSVKVKDMYKAEEIIHSCLSDYRVDNQREFFNAPMEEIKEHLDWAKTYTENRIKTLKKEMAKFKIV